VFERVRGAVCVRKCASWDGRYDDASREVGAKESDISSVQGVVIGWWLR
jgi:hypothetical protein